MSNKIYLNPIQLRGYLIDAFEEYNIWPRGSGKSSGRIAPRTQSLVFQMPRGHFVYVARTFQQLLTRTLPGVIQGLERMGYIQDRDYFIGSFAPKKWKWDKPFAPPVKAEYFMHWRNGSGISFISQDRAGMAAGLSIDAIIGDEAKHLKRDLLEEELMPANRGNRGYWDGSFKDKRINSSLHHSLMLCTDMPTSSDARWILEKDVLHDETKAQEILAIQYEIIKKQGLIRKTSSKSSATRYMAEISALTKMAQRIRKGDPEMYARTGQDVYKPSIVYSEPDIWNNIHVLGLEYIDEQKRRLPEHIFQASIMNRRRVQITNGFYPDLSETRHSYDLFNSSFFELNGYDATRYQELDSRQDADVDTYQALDLSADYGGNFNCIVVGQHHGTEYRLVNSMHVKVPEKIKDLVVQFKKYYRHHKRKEINFYYDHTAKRTDAIVEVNYIEEYVKELSKADEYGAWNVNAIDCGRTPPPRMRYEFWRKLLTDDNAEWPKFRYNRHHCEYWAISCMTAPMKIGSTGYEKDKKSERKNNRTDQFDTPQEQATHYSDAGDTLLFFRLQMDAGYSTVPAGIITSGGR